jgi:hypothetical protein
MINRAEWAVSISIRGSPWREEIASAAGESVRAHVRCSCWTTDLFWEETTQNFPCKAIIWALIVQIWFFHAVLANASLN